MNHHFATSLGQPYFAFVADGIGDLATLPVGGLAAVTAQFRVDRLPDQLVSADECHPFFSFGHDLQTQPPILEVGVTPSGRLHAETQLGPLPRADSAWHSRTGVFGDATVWNSIQVTYGVQAPGNWDVTINGVNDNNTTDSNPQTLLPVAGHNTRLMMFNGQGGLARTMISIRNLTATFVGVSGETYEWTFGEGSGRIVSPIFTELGVVMDPPFPTDLAARWYEPLTLHPWGAVPQGEPAGAYRWGLATDWTRLAKPVTAYTRVPA